MKKILLVLMVSLVNSSNTFQDLQSTPKTDRDKCDTCFLHLEDEYSEQDEYTERDNELRDDQAMSEYDQNATDTATSPQTSGAHAMIKQLYGSLLVHCAALRELAHVYYKEFKEVLAQWYHAIVKQS